MQWTDGPERWQRVLTLLHRLERLVAACAEDVELDERDRERIKKAYERLQCQIGDQVEREHQRLLERANDW